MNNDVILVVFGAIVVAFLAYSLFYPSLSRFLAGRRRKAFLAETAQSLQLTHYPKGDKELFDRFVRIGLCSGESGHEMKDLLSGGGDICFFDYRVGDRQSSSNYTTMAYCENEMSYFPEFKLTENLFNKVPKFMMNLVSDGLKEQMKGVQFEHCPEFSKKYLLDGEDSEAIQSLFTERILAYLVGSDVSTIEGKGQYLTVHSSTSSQPLSAEEYEVLISQALKIFTLFKEEC